jgi:hypothetical protein
MTDAERRFNSYEWHRVEGLFYEEEIAPILLNADYRCELVGRNNIGLALYAVYHRLPSQPKDSDA